MVFQRFNLFPHMTALENVIEAPIRVKSVPKAEAVGAGEAAAGAGRARRQARQLPVAALRRPAAARRDRTGAGDAAEADALRRADVRPGPRARRRGARRHAAAREGRHDDDRRDPRDGLRPRGGGPRSCSWTTGASSRRARRSSSSRRRARSARSSSSRRSSSGRSRPRPPARPGSFGPGRPSGEELAAVHHDLRAGHVAGEVRHHEQRRAGDLVGVSHSVHGDDRLEGRDQLLRHP